MSDEELPDIPYCPLPPLKKTKLAQDEEKFLEMQSRLEEILAIPSKNRTADEKKEYDRLRKSFTKLKGQYGHLLKEKKVKKFWYKAKK